MTLKARDSSAKFENFKTLIRNIVQCHASEISGSEKSLAKSREFNVEETATKLISFDLFEALDKVTVQKQIKSLNDSLADIRSEAVLVKDLGIGKLVPLSYETLSLIFSQTNENFRQAYFRQLIDFHYNEFCKALEQTEGNYVLTRSVFEKQVKCLLPLVKLETLLKLVKSGGSAELVSELTTDLSNYFSFPRVNQEDIYEVITNKIGSNNFKIISYEFVPLDEKNGHLGDYFRLNIDLMHHKVRQAINLFAKFIAVNSDMMQAILERGPSKKEEFFYMAYLPKLRELGLSDLLDFAPNCYFSRVNDVLILDDMSLLGFVGLTPNIKLEYESLKIAIKQIAKHHACSIIMEEILSKKEGKPVLLCDLYGEFVQEIIFCRDSAFTRDIMEGSIEIITYLSLLFREITDKYSEEQIREKARNGWNLMFEHTQKSDKYRNVINHGDLYVANMLFNFDESKKCRAVVLIDFQILRYCPAVLDAVFFIHQNSTKAVLDDHKIELLNEYYDSLSGYLQKHDVDIAEVFPREAFDKGVNEMKVVGVFQSFFYSPMQMIDPKVREQIFQDPEEVQKIMNDILGFVNFGMRGEAYRNCMRGLVQGFIELCDEGAI